MKDEKIAKGVVSAFVRVVEKGRTVTFLSLNNCSNLFFLPAKLRNVSEGDIVSLIYKDASCPVVRNVRRFNS